MSSSQLNNFVLTQEDMDEVIITPEECSTQGGERLTITFPSPIPSDPVLVFLYGSIKTHKLEAERPNNRTVSVILPAHKPAEVVDLSLYQIPGLPVNVDSDITLQPRLLLEDKLLYTDMSSYLAELLVQSATDKTQAFYSVLPPLASLDEKMLEDFDKELTSAVKGVELPDGWSLLQCEDNNTLLHFAARNSLPQLFSLLLSFPGSGTALSLRNNDGNTPFDLARESNRTSVKAILECSTLLASPPPTMNIASVEVQLLQDINTIWLRGQKRDNPSLSEQPPWELGLALLRQQISASIIDDSRLLGTSISNSASFNKGEEASPLPPNVGEVLIRGCVRKAWSRVVGNGRSRSVGTGLNELHRLQESQSLIEALKNKASERVLNKEVGPCGWSLSCPSLCDSSVTELVHSLTSSGSNIEKPVSLNGFTPTAPVPDHTHQSSSDTPHNSLETDLVSSTSPHPLPLVCVENTERGDKVCFAPSSIKTQQEEEEEEQFFSIAGYAHSSGEESEEPKTLSNPPQKNLLSKSAPSFVKVSSEAQPSTVDADYVIIDSVAAPINASNEVPEAQVPDVVPSDALLAGQVATTPSTPVSTPPVRKHKKSHSLSGVMFVDHTTEQERRLDTTQSNASSMMSIDSSKPTTTTTSSYTSSEDEEDESAFETANEISLQSKSGISLDDGPFVSLEGSFTFKPYLVLDQERRTSDDDVDGGAEREEEEEERRKKLSLVQERRYSLNIVTNIDDFSASSEDDAGNQALRRSTRSPDSATPTRQSTEMLSNRTSEGDMTLSDIEVQVGSLEEDKMPQKTKESPPINPAPFSQGSRSPRIHQRTPSTPLMLTYSTSPGSKPHDPKQTIRLLKALTQEDPPQSLPIKKSRSETLPIITIPSDSPLAAVSSRSLGGVLHTNITRNASSASDSVVTYQSSPPLQKGGVLGSSSLDFVKPPDGRSSARSSSRTSSPRMPESTTPLPPSPLYISKSPRSSPRPSLVKDMCHSPTGRTTMSSVTSPLEKKAKSVDNLLGGDELINQERDQKSVKFKREDGEEDEEFRGSQRKDIQSYLGIMDSVGEVREQPKSKGISKLFRRDSKKEKRSTKKTDSLTSLDSVFINNGQQSSQEDGKNGAPQSNKTRANSSFQAMTSVPGQSHSPIIRKPRANTIHGDINLTASTELKATPDTRRLSGGGIEEEIVPPSSPRSKSEGSTTEASEIPDENSLSVSIDDHPLLAEDDDTEVSWYQTIDRRLRRSINKHEKGRQGAIFDFIRTERHIHKAVLILKLVFRDKLASELGMSEEILNHLFPSLDDLLVVTEEFHNKLESKQQSSSMMISDISDILLEQFTGFYGKRMREAYTSFICRQSEALELYRDLERRKAKLARLMTLLYAKKQCERRKLPDFYLLITQRVAKYVEMMKKLVKETDALKLEHVDRLKKADKALQELVSSIDNGVLKYENRKKLEDIQSRLEIHVPRNYKQYSKLKGLKSLDLLAQNRVLINTVDVHWSGSGKSIAVLLVLVTDLILLLTEKDQKYHLASLHDMKPPVIRLYDLHVRVNASVRSGVQLLLLEQGSKPAMFYIEFSSKKEAKVWEERLNKAVEYCRLNDLKCEHLGVEPILSGDECKDEDEFDGDNDPLPDLSPEAIRRIMIHQALSQAHQHITVATAASLPNPPIHEVTARHSLAAAPLAQRNHQLPPHGLRNKPVRSTTFAVRTPSLDNIETKKKKKVPDRGLSFSDKKEDPAQEKKNLLECISNLKDCVEYLLKENETKSEEMAKLRHELEEAKSSNRSSPASLFRSHSAQRPRGGRPHSIHSDLFKMEDMKKEGEKMVKFREGSPSLRLRNQ